MDTKKWSPIATSTSKSQRGKIIHRRIQRNEVLLHTCTSSGALGKSFTDGYKEMKVLLWTHHETPMLGEEHCGRNGGGKEKERKTSSRMVGWHQGMDWFNRQPMLAGWQMTVEDWRLSSRPHQRFLGQCYLRERESFTLLHFFVLGRTRPCCF